MSSELLGKTMLIRCDGRILPVFCFDDSGPLLGMQLRPKKNNDDLRSPWIVGVGDHGLREESVAMVSRIKSFSKKDVVRVLGVVSPAVVEKAQIKKLEIEQRPAMIERKKEVLHKIAAERRKGHKTKGLNRELKKLNRKINGPGKPGSKPGGPVAYEGVNPKPMQGGRFSPR